MTRREIDRALDAARLKPPARRSRRDRWLVLHNRLGHRLEGRDNHDACLSCGAVFYRPNQ